MKIKKILGIIAIFLILAVGLINGSALGESRDSCDCCFVCESIDEIQEDIDDADYASAVFNLKITLRMNCGNGKLMRALALAFYSLLTGDIGLAGHFLKAASLMCE